MTKTENDFDDVDITSRLLNLIFDMPVELKLRLIKILDKWESEGARKHQRKPWVIPIAYSTDDQAFKDVIKDISNGGVFIETKKSFTAGQTITMNFRLSKSQKLIQATGEIVRSNSQGIGVKFKRQSNKRY
jgi:hypothetical protein